MNEIWKNIIGFQNYIVSSVGNVKNIKTDYVLNPSKDKDGYLYVTLCENKKQKKIGIHILVAMYFIGPKPKGCVVNHKDGIKTNNMVENLEWCTHSQNMQHAYKNGLAMGGVGEKNSRAILTFGDVLNIKVLINDGKTNAIIAKRYGVHVSTISAIRVGKTWSSVIMI